jgi:prevent-host-death family protein
MKEIPATEAKNRFGELLSALEQGPVAVTRNGRVIAHVTSARSLAPVTNPEALRELLTRYSQGVLNRRDLQEQTGLSFGEVLQGLGELELSLPRVKTAHRYSAKQRSLHEKVFGR